MAIIDKFSPLANFWESHPQLTIPKAFKEFWENDSSKGKEKSSKVMWAIGLVYDYESEYADQLEVDRVKIIEDDYLESPAFFTKYYKRMQPLIETYMKIQETAPRRAFAEWLEGMDRRTKFLHETPYTVENGAKLDKMRAETGKQLETMEKMRQEYLVKKANTNTEADYMPSLLELGDI